MRRRRSCVFVLFFGIGVVLALAAGGVLLAVIEVRDGLSPLEIAYLSLSLGSRQDEIDSPIAADDTQIVFVVNLGDTPAVIGGNLQAQGLISDGELFRNYVRYNGLDSDLEAGTYLLRRTQSLAEIAQALTDSSRTAVTVRIIEGWRREEIAASLDTIPLLAFGGADFLAATGPGATIPPAFAAYVNLPAGASLEGFLYPETYFLSPDTTVIEFRDRLLSTFQERVTPTLQSAALSAGRNLYDVVIIASIAEREAVHDDELPRVSSVYLNRLAIGMKLDADPTVQYGIGWRNGTWWPDITQAEYQTAVSPYNTYLIEGLPPGPIANPSLAAIEAAIFPEETNFYYFRATCAQDGYHNFATTFDEHVANGNCP